MVVMSLSVPMNNARERRVQRCSYVVLIERQKPIYDTVIEFSQCISPEGVLGRRAMSLLFYCYRCVLIPCPLVVRQKKAMRPIRGISSFHPFAQFPS